MMNDDIALLREFAASQSERAFETLVMRHIPLVYSAALRCVGDPHLAEEITQVVFIILARKAQSLGDKIILSGWLYRTVQYASADALKMQQRRQRREQEAYMQSILENSQTETAWRELAPLLDEAMIRLRQTDRDAVVLRFFENKSLAEVGGALGLQERAAQKRITRALEKLRIFFAKRGVVSTTTIIAGAISANSVQAAPVSLAVTISSTAAGGMTLGGSTTVLIKATMKTITWIKLKFAAGMGAALLLAGGAATVVLSDSTPAPESYFPKPSETVTRALTEFRVARDKITVGGAMKIVDARPIHEAFFASVDMNRVSVWDAAAIVNAPVFTFHPEQAQVLRRRLRTIKSQTSGVEAELAAAISFRLPRPDSESAEENEIFARAFLDRPELSILLHSEHAQIALEAIANVPRKVAQEHASQMLGFAGQLDPLTSSSAVFVVENYLRAVSPLAPAPGELDLVRARIIAFTSTVLAGADKVPNLSMWRHEIERTLQSLTNAVAQGRFVGHPAPALNFLWASRPNLKTLADLKGKVVVLDFWATWCGPCIESFPRTRELAEFYRNFDVEIVGVTSLQGVVSWPDGKLLDCKDDPEKEMKLIGEYRTLQKMDWTVAISREPVINLDFGIPGIPYMIIIAPDGTVRHTAINPNTSLPDQRKLIYPILREFGLKTP